MSRRTLLLLSLLGLVASAAVLAPNLTHWWPETGGARPAATEPRARSAPESRAVLSPSLDERLARIDGRLRLPPDARALRAIGEIAGLLRRETPVPAEAVRVGSGWKITHSGREVGTLSEYPTFASLLALLDAWTEDESSHAVVAIAKNSKPDPALMKKLAGLDDQGAFAVLGTLDERWNSGHASAGDLAVAANALAQLALVLPDPMASGDSLPTRALTALVLARHYAPEHTPRAEALLAHLLGYEAHAFALSDKLEASDPLRAFLRDDREALARAVKGPKPTAQALYFQGRSLALHAHAEEWIEWYGGLAKERAWSAAMMRTHLDVGGVEVQRQLPNLYAAVLLTGFGVEIDRREDMDRVFALCPKLTAAVSKRAGADPGPFAAAEFAADVYRRACLGAAHEKLVFYLDWFGSPKDALALAQTLGETDPDSAALRAWAELVVAELPPERKVGAVQQMLRDTAALGVTQRERLAKLWFALLQVESPGQVELADALSSGLDSRPGSRSVAGRIARDYYRDLGLTESLWRVNDVAYGANAASWRAFMAGFRDDWETLWTLADTPDLPADVRRDTLWRASYAPSVDNARVRAAYEREIRREPGSEQLRRNFAKFLETQVEDRAAAREELRAILGMYPEGLTADHVLADIARLYRLDGKYEESWKLVEPRLEGMVGTILSEAVRAKLGLGDLKGAESLARSAYERYPDSAPTAADLAMVLWRQGRNTEAAQVIAKHPRNVSRDSRVRSFMVAFSDTFGKRPKPEAEAAFKELFAAHLDYDLLQSTIDHMRDVDAETAFALGLLMDLPDGQIQMDTESYKSLKLARGEAAALEWVRGRISRDSLTRAAKIFYFREADELLWTLIDDADKLGGEATWTVRAAAFVRERPPQDAHRQALEQHYATHRDSFGERIGAAIVGQLDADALLREAHDERQLVAAAYHLGARAEQQGDLRRAMRLYQLALSCKAVSGEVARDFVGAAIEKLRKEERSLDAIAAAREATAATPVAAAQ